MLDRSDDFKLENVFLCIALFFGLLYVFILPPFQSVDEEMHFYRTYQISSGNFFAKNNNGLIGDVLPKSLSDFSLLYRPMIKNIDIRTGKSDIARNFNLKLDEDKTTFVEFPNTALYPPVSYITQCPGVLLGKALNMPLAGIYYLGRVFNLISYCLLIYFAIKVIPFFKLPLMLLALMPMSLSLAAAFTSDVVVLGLNFLWIALILKLITAQKTKLLPATLVFLAFLLPLAKNYILFLPLIFLTPLKTFKNNKRTYILFTGVVIFAAVISSALWYLAIKGLTLTMNPIDADAALQAKYIVEHPFEYAGILLKTFIVKAPRLAITMIGVLGWQDTKLDWITYILYPILIYFAVVSDNFNFKLEKWQKYLILINLMIGTIVMYTSLYLAWSPVGNPIVLGLNGKYFIPFMMPLFLLFKNNVGRFDYDKVKVFAIIAVVLILFSSELSLLHRFYDITPNLYYKI